MSDEHRLLEFETEVPGTPEEVWRAIATGPGISSWYVPHVVEEREGGEATASFGDAPEMQVTGRVAVWDPPRRVVFDGGEGVEGLAFEWLVEAKSGDTCIVRLVNSGFSSAAEWDDQFDAMNEGWRIFLFNLGLHLEHFPGQTATAALPMATWSGPRDEAWSRLTANLGLDEVPDVGDRALVAVSGLPKLGGIVIATTRSRISLLVDEPVPGTAFIAAEGRGEAIEVSIWSYLYGDDGVEASRRDGPIWQEWLSAHAAPTP
jgi:uncharacterized protein YndB with AHSA1/START domain